MVFCHNLPFYDILLNHIDDQQAKNENCEKKQITIDSIDDIPKVHFPCTGLTLPDFNRKSQHDSNGQRIKPGYSHYTDFRQAFEYKMNEQKQHEACQPENIEMQLLVIEIQVGLIVQFQKLPMKNGDRIDDPLKYFLHPYPSSSDSYSYYTVLKPKFPQ
jgi:hypothetical protein